MSIDEQLKRLEARIQALEGGQAIVRFYEVRDTPPAPADASGWAFLYVKEDGQLYRLNDDGTETLIG